MGSIRVGCQTYTWEMLGTDWQGTLADIIAEVAAAGYAGIEISSHVLGGYVERPLEVKKWLEAHQLELAALAYSTSSGFTDAGAYKADIDGLQQMLAFLQHFPGAVLGLAGANSPSKHQQYAQIDQACRFYNEAGRLAAAAGIRVNVHPHSHHGSLLETDEEYSYLLAHLDPIVEFGPDSGHIIRGEQDLATCVRKHVERIGHIHFKDVKNRQWTPVGHGESDFPQVVAILEAAGYSGWIIAEEEATWTLEGRSVVLPANRQYIEKLLAQ